MKKWIPILIALLVMAVLAVPAMAQISLQAAQDAAQAAVAAGDPFPAGTVINSVQVDGAAITVDLSSAVITPSFGDSDSDAIVKALDSALSDLDYTSLEVTVDGKVISDYLPHSETSGQSVEGLSMASRAVAESLPTIPVIGSELAGKKIVIAPSHGLYQLETTGAWDFQRPLNGPGDGYGTYGAPYIWPRVREDVITLEIMRYLKYYLESAGAQVFVPKEMDPDSGNHPFATFEGKAVPWTQICSRDYLQYAGYPEWIWNEPSLTRNYDKDIRARPYFANYYNADCMVALHTNAASSGTATGTETYYYTQASNPQFKKDNIVRYANGIQSGVVNAIRGYFDDTAGIDLYAAAKPGSPYSGYVLSSGYPWYARWRGRGNSASQSLPAKSGNYGEVRESNCVSSLTELAFHDDWYNLPDNLFLNDEAFRATAMWGMYEGICKFFGVTPRPKAACDIASNDMPTLMKPGAEVTASVDVTNLGVAWVASKRYDAANNSIQLKSLYKLAPMGEDPFGGSAVALATNESVLPGQTKSFAISLKAPAEDGVYVTSWQMLKDDNRGTGALGISNPALVVKDFGPVLTKEIMVDGTAPVITISSPADSYLHTDKVSVGFSATDSLSGVASISATIDGQAIANGDQVDLMDLALGIHTLKVTAIDVAGNTAVAEKSFNVIATLDSQANAVVEFFANGAIDNKGIYTGLLAKLAQDAKKAGKTSGARDLQKSFINELEAQRGKHIAADAADWLLSDALAIQASL